MARGEARDPISVRTSLPQTLQQQQDLARIVPVAGARLAVSPPPDPFPPSARSPEPRYPPIRDLWIIARLIPPARPKRESIAEDEDSIRFDDVSATSVQHLQPICRSRLAFLPRSRAPRARNQNASDDNRSKRRLIDEQEIRISNFWSVTPPNSRNEHNLEKEHMRYRSTIIIGR